MSLLTWSMSNIMRSPFLVVSEPTTLLRSSEKVEKRAALAATRARIFVFSSLSGLAAAGKLEGKIKNGHAFSKKNPQARKKSTIFQAKTQCTDGDGNHTNFKIQMIFSLNGQKTPHICVTYAKTFYTWCILNQFSTKHTAAFQ